jgi:hypothetical protein
MSWLAACSPLRLQRVLASLQTKKKDLLISSNRGFLVSDSLCFQRLYCDAITPTQPSPIEGPSRGRGPLGSAHPIFMPVRPDGADAGAGKDDIDPGPCLEPCLAPLCVGRTLEGLQFAADADCLQLREDPLTRTNN